MAGNQKNFQYFAYLDDDGTNWNVRGELNGAFTAIDGHATFDAANPVWSGRSGRNHPRYVVAQEPTTLRTAQGTIYTPTAFAAVTKGSSVSVDMEGVGTAVEYTIVEKVAEKKKSAKASSNKIDHA